MCTYSKIVTNIIWVSKFDVKFGVVVINFKIIIEIMVFPLDDNFVFGDNFFFLGDNIFLAPLVDILQLFAKWAEVEKKWVFFSWLMIFFSPKATKKITQPREKKLLTNKRSYSSNGNTIISMIWRFYAPLFF